MSYSVLLENPRRRRKARKSGRRRSSRRRNPSPAASQVAPDRRRRRGGIRRSSKRRRGGRRSNPFKLPFVGSIGGGVIGEGIKLHLAEFGLQIAERASNWLPGIRGVNPSWKRIGLGLVLPFVMKKLRVPAGFANTFGAVAIAQGLYYMTMTMRNSVLGTIGLGDYVTSLDGMEPEDGDLSEAPYGLLGLGNEDGFEPDDSGALNDYVTEMA